MPSDAAPDVAPEGGEPDLEFELEVALVTAVDRAVTAYHAKRDGRREFCDFVELAPRDVRALIRDVTG